MKKIFICLSVLVLLGFGIIPVNAMLGVPDDVPGKDILVPFFYVSMPGFGDDNTIITITEVGLYVPPASSDPFFTLYYTVYDKNGNPRYNNDLDLATTDVVTIDAYSILQAASSNVRASLETDVDGDGVNDHWVGYIYFDNDSELNNLIAHVYQGDLQKGRVAAYNPPRLEDIPGVGFEPYPAERLMFRYNILNGKSDNLIFIWTDETNLPTTPTVIYVYDEDAHGVSVAIPITYGLNIIDSSFAPKERGYVSATVQIASI